MSTCKTCGSDRNVVIENYVTCIDCGTQNDYQPKYVQGYATPHAYQRRQYYSRIKRFAKTLKMMKSDVIGNNTEAILNTYSSLEFSWNVNQEKTRKYFFSQKVILFFILEKLGIELKVPVLKNQERTEQQLERMQELQKMPGVAFLW